jgi:hypothetical protein
MSKKTIYLAVFLGLFCLVGGNILAVSITAPPGVPTTFPALFEKIASAVAVLIASLGGVMIIISGILFLTSAGNPERLTKARTALIYAIAGIAIGLAASGIIATIKTVIGAT